MIKALFSQADVVNIPVGIENTKGFSMLEDARSVIGQGRSRQNIMFIPNPDYLVTHCISFTTGTENRPIILLINNELFKRRGKL
jgi:hypothetical protein